MGTIPDVINNSLAFSWDNILDILPALPSDWRTGSIDGLIVRGQIKIDRLSWNMDSGEIQIAVTSAREQEILVRLPDKYAVRTIKSHEKILEQNDPVEGNRWKIKLPKDKSVQVSIFCTTL